MPTADIDPSMLYVQEIMSLEKYCIELQISCQKEIYNKHGMPKNLVLAYHHGLRSYYSLLKPILDDNLEEPAINKLFKNVKKPMKALSRASHGRAIHRKAEKVFDELCEIFEELLESKNNHDLSVKTRAVLS